MWGILLQSLTVSLVAALLLAVKALLKDQLSPRWQYGIWSVLAVRILLPVSVSRFILLPLPLWLETAKAVVEKRLHSAYSGVYTPISVWNMPKTAPVSVTDWLLILYLAGVVVFGLRYVVSYVRLRRLVKTGIPMELEGVSCPVVVLSGLPSAFVCGVCRPILVVPGEVDEKILLHEQMHLRYQDALQSVFWCLCRCLHWWNPFLHFIFDRIGNDMESLCDQRVLERLDGEDRRDYGRILVQMANEPYARAPGTTSLSNGGRNIARRVEALVRFKLYPKGMALVSVCIGVVLLSPCFLGNTYTNMQLAYPAPVKELDAAMAYARINRCESDGEALDYYLRGLKEENGIYMAMATSLSEHGELEAAMRENAADGWVAYHYETYNGLECIDGSSIFRCWNGNGETAEGRYETIIHITVYGFLDEEGHLILDEADNVVSGYVEIPVTVEKEPDGWVVRETGPRVRQGQYGDYV